MFDFATEVRFQNGVKSLSCNICKKRTVPESVQLAYSSYTNIDFTIDYFPCRLQGYPRLLLRLHLCLHIYVLIPVIVLSKIHQLGYYFNNNNIIRPMLTTRIEVTMVDNIIRMQFGLTSASPVFYLSTEIAELCMSVLLNTLG